MFSPPLGFHSTSLKKMKAKTMKILTQISLNGSFCISYREKSPEGPPETCFLTGDPAKNEVQGLKRPLPVVLKTSEVAKRKEEADLLYQNVYGSKNVPYPGMVNRLYNRKRVPAKERNLEDSIDSLKEALSSRIQEESPVDEVRETGLHLSIEAMTVKMPLCPGNQLLFCVPCIITKFEDGSFVQENFPSFNRSTSESENEGSEVTQEVFVRTKGQKGASIYFIVNGTFEKPLLDGSKYFHGHRRVARLLNKNGTDILKLESSIKSLVFESTTTPFDYQNWVPDEKEVSQFKDKPRGKVYGESYLSIEVTGTSKHWMAKRGIVPKEEEDEKSFSRQSSSKSQTPSTSSHRVSSTKGLIKRFRFVLDLKEGTPSSSASSSGYSSCLDEVHRDLVVDLSPSNSCVMCGKVYPTLKGLLTHLETRYPLLSFAYDTQKPEEMVASFEQLPGSGSAVNFTKSMAQIFRSEKLEMMSNASNGYVSRGREVPQPVYETNYPCNFVEYEPLPNNQYGVITPTAVFNAHVRRRMEDFEDVSESEKLIMLTWNEHANKREHRVVTEETGSKLLKSYTQKYGDRILEAGAVAITSFMVNAANKYRIGEVSSEAIKEAVKILYEAKQNPDSAFSSKQAPVKKAKRTLKNASTENDGRRKSMRKHL